MRGKGQSEMFAADFPEKTKIEKSVDMIVDSLGVGEPNATKNTPDERAEEELTNVHQDIAGYGDPEDINNEYPPGPQDEDGLGEVPDDDYVRDGGIGSQLESILSINEKGEYQKFFKRMMDEEGVSSIGQMSHDQKSSFFTKVSARWKKEKGKTVAESFPNLI